jgi:hypothetical protein
MLQDKGEVERVGAVVEGLFEPAVRLRVARVVQSLSGPGTSSTAVFRVISRWGVAVSAGDFSGGSQGTEGPEM